MAALRRLYEGFIDFVTGLLTLGRIFRSSTRNETAAPKNDKKRLTDLGTSETVRLPDERILGYSSYGCPTGYPVLYFHGFPGSRLEAAIWHQDAVDSGVRIIGLDRPGVGLSSPHPGRTVLTHAEDAQYLAKHLELERYSVIGTSGGGPYALACAQIHPPERLNTVTLVVGMGPFDIGLQGMGVSNRIVFWLFRYAPWITRLLAKLSAAQLRSDKVSEEKLMEITKKQLESRWRLTRMIDKEKQAMLSNEDSMLALFASGKEFVFQGADAFNEEGRLFTTEQGLRLETINAPVKLWYGKLDIQVSASMGQRIADRLPTGMADMHLVDESHISLLLNCRKQILEDLLSVA